MYDERPDRVTARKGSMVTARHCDHSVTRNSSVRFFKRTIPELPTHDSDTEDDFDDDAASEQLVVAPNLDEPPDDRRYPQRERRRPVHLDDYVLAHRWSDSTGHDNPLSVTWKARVVYPYAYYSCVYGAEFNKIGLSTHVPISFVIHSL